MSKTNRFSKSARPAARLVVWKDQPKLDATKARLDAEAVASLRTALSPATLAAEDPMLFGLLNKLGCL